jgi:hypothetical protein
VVISDQPAREGIRNVISSFRRFFSIGLGDRGGSRSGHSSGVMDFDSFKPQVFRHDQKIR